MASEYSSAVKNGLLFGVVILVAHAALCRALEDGEAKPPTSVAPPLRPAAAPSAAPRPPPEPLAAPVAQDNGGDLMAYVFGGGSASDVESTTTTMTTTTLSSSTKQQQQRAASGELLADAPSANGGCLVIGSWPNENIMCGGRDDGLEGFENSSSNYALVNTANEEIASMLPR